MNQLEQLRQLTTVVADSGDIDAIRRLQPTDATTNPSLILQAGMQAQYRPLLNAALQQHRDDISAACEQVTVNFGVDILRYIPGRVSTEIDAHLSFDTSASVDSALRIIERYQAAGIAPQRVLIKLAATWQGIQAAAQLEKQGIHCNLTLLFSLTQAKACADAGVTLISPFVGRILDWYKQHQPEQDFSGANDPGVQSVQRIYQYYKQHGINTVIMGASFRNVEQIRRLAGCDLLTIAPNLLQELAATDAPLVAALQMPLQHATAAAKPLSAAEFFWQLNEDAMASDKLAEGIRKFAVDQRKLAQLLSSLNCE
ncbi:transaldolase [Rheinheimera sp.]|uniref:transaldolase n=1 Tax=Rheinheimera sp. TaxID=1869214 RepID=UPI002734E6CF|nr:transaldolase [Rheinheimera sp.]MDP2716907.1 transaldolase [Rheinheimera sp.]